jgi:TPR repeat protein
MRRASIVAAVGLAAFAGASAWAGPLEDGIGAARNGDYSAALFLLQPLADQGNPEAEFALGDLYGSGIIMDAAKAADWYRRAANQGLPEAENNLGALYSSGEGVPSDPAQALRWWRLAADHGLATAQANLADLLSDGDRVPQDLVQAYKWSSLAALQGEPRSARILDKVSREMTQDEISTAERLVESWMPPIIRGL